MLSNWMTNWRGAPSSKPRPLLHLILDPLKHMLAERTEANNSYERTKVKTSEKGFSHLEAKLADKCLTKCEASLKGMLAT